MKIKVKLIPWIVILGVLQAIPANAGVEVIDTGKTLGEYPNLHWMDNKRVIFTAASGSYCEKEDGYKQPLNQIVIFDTETRKVQGYGEAGVNGLCYAEGNVSYARRVRNGNSCPTDRYEHYMGKLGHEVLTEGAGKINTYTCRPESELPPLPDWMEVAQKEGRLFKRLRPEHGWVELGKTQNAGSLPSEFPIRLYRPGAKQSEGIAIRGIEGKDIDPIWTYYPFRNAYLLPQWTHVDPYRGAFSLWWLNADGKIDVAMSANFDGKGLWSRFYAVENGLLTSHGRSRYKPIEGNLGDAGMYLFDTAGAHRKLIAGSIGAISISPNGCKVAFGNDGRSYNEGTERMRLQVLDVCQINK